MQNITAIIVSYQRLDLLRACLASVRQHYPELKVIIVDGSPLHSVCSTYVGKIGNRFTKTVRLDYNIGHGRGMKKGIELCKTSRFLLLDSDVTIDRPGVLEDMSHHLDQYTNCYGVGRVVTIDDKGLNAAKGAPYLHPHFALVDKAVYQQYAPIIHHGSPMLKAMIDLAAKQKHFLFSFPVENYITHKERGTRSIHPKEFRPNTWEK
jgi:GT2 family glycosyltransferase